MRFTYLLAVGLAGVSAFPDIPLKYARRDVDPELYEIGLDPYFLELEKRADTPATIVSKKEKNCGPVDCLVFSATEQYVSNTGQHGFASPAPDELRGPCPGLNAAANHAYLDRSGIQDIGSTTAGLAQAYQLAADFGAFLAVFSSIVSGDINTLTWSIGGPMPYEPIGNEEPPQGISFAHNKYEGDVSIGREDAYVANGDAHSLNVTRWKRAYGTCLTGGGCTLDGFRKAFTANVYWSIHHNPYYFSPPLAGAVVPPAAYNFVINFMSNRSQENPNGILSPENFKTFFSVVGSGKNMVWQKGQEKIPDNWYRRTSTNPYGAAALVEDDAIGWAAYPESLRIGGNLGKVNSYQGADISKLTGGQFTFEDFIKDPHALGCFAFQGQEAVLPDELKGGINDAHKALQLFKKFFAPISKELDCPALDKYDASVFTGYKGYYYSPTGKATNY